MPLVAGAAAGLCAARLSTRRAPFNFREKVVFLTGGSRGLGLVLARELIRRGARVALCARDEEELLSAADELRVRGGDVAIFPCDLRDRESVATAISRAGAHFGRLDVLINNAGVIQVGPYQTMTEEDYRQALDTHFWGPFYALQGVLPEFRKRREGRIINIASIGGKIAVPHLLPYSVSKFALTGFSEGLGAELAREGIVVTTVCPGLMRTGSPRNVQVKGDHQKEYTWFLLGDSLPGLSMGAERAARKILDASERGDRAIVIGLPFRLAAAFHGLFPGLTVRMMEWTNRLLPKAPLTGGRRVQSGAQSDIVPAFAKVLTEKAAWRNNEMKKGA